jgi:DnaJ-class molecular chaperone
MTRRWRSGYADDAHNAGDALCPVCDGSGDTKSGVCRTCQGSGVVVGLVRAGILRQQRREGKQ